MMFRTLRYFAIGLIGAAMISGCARHDPMPHSIVAGDVSYFPVFEEWSQSAKIYHHLQTKFFADITYHSRDFWVAYAAEVARTQKQTGPEQEQFFEQQRDIHSRFVVFTLSVYTPYWNQNDFEKSNSIWRIVLRINGNEYHPDKIEEISRKDERAKYFFPYMNIWSDAYTVYFDRRTISDWTGSLEFQMSSHLGSKVFRFNDTQMARSTPAGNAEPVDGLDTSQLPEPDPNDSLLNDSSEPGLGDDTGE